MLAEAAKKAGFKILVIDIYGDQETRNEAQEFRQISSLDKDNLLPAVDYFIDNYAVTHMVYGSGFEQYPENLGYLNNRLAVLGNTYDVFVRLQNKPDFFSVLKTLVIPYPEVIFERPPLKTLKPDTDWLIKPMQGQGGVGISVYKGCEASKPSDYWQKYLDGIAYSVLFLADGHHGQIIGFNRQWTTQLNSKDEFIFSGIINTTGLSKEQKAEISAWLDKLIPVLSLKGLNSLDFIQSGNVNHVLEINPRPPASLQLYDADLFNRHIRACQGKLWAYKPMQAGITGLQIVYAEQDVKLTDSFVWPEGAQDRPSGDSIISAGQPICSIISHQKEPQAVLEQLQVRHAFIINQLDRFQSHGI
ncbi:MAG: ATP-grasp domain-containing protein [Methyloglobulus sp.]|nr:ATP-grasp domain-containing protein [Methyloglobulus sp.]